MLRFRQLGFKEGVNTAVEVMQAEANLEKAKTDPNALFAVGWFSGREQASSEQCAVSLKTVKNAPKFW